MFGPGGLLLIMVPIVTVLLIAGFSAFFPGVARAIRRGNATDRAARK